MNTHFRAAGAAFLLTAVLVFCPCVRPAVAMEENKTEAPQTGGNAGIGITTDKNGAPAVNLQIGAEMKKAFADYDAATKNLTAEQKKTLDGMTPYITKAIEIPVKTIIISARLSECLKNAPAMKPHGEEYSKQYQTWRASLQPAKIKAYVDLRSWLDTIHFVDRGVLYADAQAHIKMMLMTMTGVELALEKGKKDHTVGCDDVVKTIYNGHPPHLSNDAAVPAAP
ncbi:MAG: hypothetical protein GC185_13295 [Alphaproteobacteria bacterium]|nr:hypothetical protein [Alphaproteobacteria bacterium]